MVIKSLLKQTLPTSIKDRVKNIVYPQLNAPPASTKPLFEFWIDIVSGCNLRCAACPVGMPEFTNSIGKQLREMSLDTFERICVKA
jgi:hypothetical protein